MLKNMQYHYSKRYDNKMSPQMQAGDESWVESKGNIIVLAGTKWQIPLVNRIRAEGIVQSYLIYMRTLLLLNMRMIIG